MPDERRQYRVLYRDFLFRMIDVELLAAHGEIGKLVAQFAAMLAAFSFVFAIGFVPRYVFSTLPRARLLMLAWVDQEFLIATTMAVAGLFAVLAWNAVLPDRRDSLVLGVLPLRTRTIFLAKVAAIATALGLSVAAVNIFTGFCYPFIVGGWRSLVAYWLAQALAGAFVCGALLALQGLLAQCLSRRLFLRISSWVQLAAFFGILGFYFLKPGFPAGAGLAAVAGGAWLPSFWFFGLLQKLDGSANPVFGALAGRALWGLGIVLVAAPATFALAYGRSTRRIVEQPDITPADRSRPASRLASFLAAKLVRKPIERAILLFTTRTIARSRQHRLLLAAYGGIGLAIALVYAKDILYGYSTFVWTTVNSHARARVPWDQPSTSLMAATLVLLCFAVIGFRAVFALPIELSANWIFRLTAIARPAAYFAAVRKSFFAVAVAPLWIASAILYLAIWPAHGALEQMAFLFASGILLAELSLHRFRKVPFTCSYLPGKANLDVRLGVYGLLLVIAADLGVEIEFWSMHRLTRFFVVLALLVAAAIWARRRTTAFAASPYYQVQFEDLPADDVAVLDLRRDGIWSAEEPPPGTVDTRRDGPVAQAPGRVLFTAALPREPVSLRTVLEELLRDFRSGVRILTRSPGFSAAVVALIALGIGGNVTIYSMIHAVLSKPAPGISASNLVSFGRRSQDRANDPADSFPNYVDYSIQSRSMASIAASAFERFTLGLEDGVWQLRGEMVTANYFQTLGVKLAKGREFTAEEARGAAPLAAIVTDHVWRNQFHGAPDILGQTVLLNGRPATIVGVGPPEFRGTAFAPNLEICVPLLSYMRMQGTAAVLGDRSHPRLDIIGRLADGVSLAQAQAEFATISRRLQAAYPDANRNQRVELRPYSAAAFSPIARGQAQVFMAIVMVVALATLLIVCANVALLLLARAGVRQRELALRLSLGASRLRILRILLAEGLALSLIAAVAAWLMALWVTGVVGGLVPPLESGAQLQADLTPDWRVAAYALVLAVAATLVFTLAPAVRAWRQPLLPSLKAGEHGVAHGRSRLGGILVIAQLALCVVLLLGGALAYRSLFLIDTADPGFRKDHLLLAAVNTAGAAGGAEQNLALLERIRERLLSVPGVTAVSWAIAAPPHSHGWMGSPVQAGLSAPPVRTDGTFVGPDEIEALGVPILAGRGITVADLKRPHATAAINQKLADALWPGHSAVGRTMLLEGQPVEVTGVVPDGVFSGVAEDGSFSGLGKVERRNFVFLAEQQRQPGQRTFHVRYTGDLNRIAPAVRAAIREVDSRVPVFSVRTMDTEWAEFTAPIRIITTLLALFGIGALALASVGLYAVVAFQTARRTRELGIRMALGASPGQALGAVLKEGLRLTALGVAGGLLLSAAAGRAFGSLLFGVTPTDAPTYLAVLSLLVLVSLIACYLPARRAARIDPVRALRED